MDHQNPILDKINASAMEISSLASEFIAFNSTTGQEGKLAIHLAKMLSTWGISVETFEVNPDDLAKNYPKEFFRSNFSYEGRSNVLGRVPGTGGGKSLMINFHLDVVNANPEAWKVDPWKGTVQGGMLYGRGAADMKGGMAAALYAIKCILDANVRLKGDLIIAGVIEEEGPGNGTLAVQARGISADGCIIPEPTDLSMALCLTGGVYGLITVTGKSAHSTTHWLGVNALEKAFLVVQGIQEWRNQRMKVGIDPLYMHAPRTASSSPILNMVRTDGSVMGRIPSSVQIRTRATVMPGENPYQVAQAMEKAILSTVLQDNWFIENPPAFHWDVRGGRSYPAKISPDHPLPETLAESFREVTGRSPEVRGFISPADMQHLLNIDPRTPTVMFGPGSLYDAHTDNEKVSIDQMTKASAVLARFILNWCGVV
jgi:acetylornithine deacetylase